MAPSPSFELQSEDELFGIHPGRHSQSQSRSQSPSKSQSQSQSYSQYETVATLPVDRSSYAPELDTQGFLPNLSQPRLVHNAHQYSQPPSQHQTYIHNLDSQPSRPHYDSQFVTQPTQIIQRSPGADSLTDFSSPPRKPVVHVAASSPMAAPRPRVPGQSSVLGQAMNRGTLGMAPVGTQIAPHFRQAPQQQYHHYQQSSSQFSQPSQVINPAAHENLFQPIDTDSDEDPVVREQYRMKTKFAPRNQNQNQKQNPPPAQRPALPPAAAQGTFASLMSEFNYQPNGHSQGIKRSGDVLANSYGNMPAKRSRQVAPSRAQPVLVESQGRTTPQVTDVNDIQDPNLRNKVKRLLEVFQHNTIDEAIHALTMTRGVYDDATDWLARQQNRLQHDADTAPNGSSRRPIVMPSSEDELGMSPARPKGVAVSNHYAPHPTQQARKPPVKSIAQKYSSTQHQNIAPATVPVPTSGPVSTRFLNVFDTPPPQEAKKGRLMRGRRNRSPSPAELARRHANTVTIDDSDEDEEDRPMPADDDSLTAQVLEFFNTCTAVELSDISGLPKDQAEHIVASRPFRKMEAVFGVQNPANKNKTKKGSTSFGERAWDKVYDMTRSYIAVDQIVTICQNKSKPLARSMSSWGVDVFGKGKETGLDLVNLPKDSGLGTPISDDGAAVVVGKKGFLGQPATLAQGVKMKDYQVVGLNWLFLLYSSGLSGILADDMGLGKTLQTIAFLAHLKSIGEHGPHLIVVPSATLENWLKEFNRFAPAINAQPYYGSMAEREDMRYTYEKDRNNLDVLVTTYVIAKAKDDAPWLRKFGFTCAIFDEGHMLKNPTSEVATKLTRIQSRFRLLLTGTPLQNNLHELMGLLKFLQPAIFREFEEELQAIFKQSISVTTDAAADSREMLLSKQRIDRARSMLTPFILRRKKWQVLKDLPKKTRHVEKCDLSYEQVEIYNQQLGKAWEIRERKSKGERIPADESANVLIRLRQAAIHPLLFRYFYDDKTLRKIAKTCPKIEQFRMSNPDLILTELTAYADFETHDLCSKHKLLHSYMLAPHLWECSGKVVEMLELLRKFKKEGHRTLIFSQFVMVLDILQIVLNNNDIPFLRLDGSTRVDERQDLIDLFNAEGSEYETFMLSTKAGGAGINLTGASRVIVFDSGFNPQDDVQAENRCHRIGQTKDVEVYRLISKHTVEEQIYEMGNIKLQLDKEVSGADGAEGALDVPISGIATPMEDEEVTSKKGRSKKTDSALSKREQEGAVMIEDMLFKKLESQEGRGQSANSPPRIKVETKLKPIRIKQEEGGSPVAASLDGSADSPLSELSSIASDDERLQREGTEEAKVKEDLGGRSRRKAATKAAENLKDPLDEPLDFEDDSKSRKSPRKVKKEPTNKGQSTISKSGRLVRGKR